MPAKQIHRHPLTRPLSLSSATTAAKVPSRSLPNSPSLTLLGALTRGNDSAPSVSHYLPSPTRNLLSLAVSLTLVPPDPENPTTRQWHLGDPPCQWHLRDPMHALCTPSSIHAVYSMHALRTPSSMHAVYSVHAKLYARRVLYERTMHAVYSMHACTCSPALRTAARHALDHAHRSLI